MSRTAASAPLPPIHPMSLRPPASPAHPRLVHALVCGIALFYLLVVHVNGHLSALHVPHAYFAWFGPQRLVLALVTLQSLTGLVVAVLVAGGVLATARLLRARSWPFLGAVFGGMLLCWLYWTLLPQFLLPTPPLAEQLAMFAWWTLPSLAAPWLGFAGAAWLLRRRT